MQCDGKIYVWCVQRPNGIAKNGQQKAWENFEEVFNPNLSSRSSSAILPLPSSTTFFHHRTLNSICRKLNSDMDEDYPFSFKLYSPHVQLVYEKDDPNATGLLRHKVDLVDPDTNVSSILYKNNTPLHNSLLALHSTSTNTTNTELYAVYEKPPQTLHSLLRTSFLHNGTSIDLRCRFIFLQLLRAVDFVHSRGLTFRGNLNPHNLFMGSDGWVKCVVPLVQVQYIEPEHDHEHYEEHGEQPDNHNRSNVDSEEIDLFDFSSSDDNESIDNLARSRASSVLKTWNDYDEPQPKQNKIKQNRPTPAPNPNPNPTPIIPYPGTQTPLTTKWRNGSLSNFDYLMAINVAAGRTPGDPFAHPVFPWVTNFTSEIENPNGLDGPWRNLSKSKFRLNKGDAQLDIQYKHSLPPHNITENLSDITYYMYLSRRTPISTLKKVVRQDFVPKHYPGELPRLYEFNPDECIPDFFTNPEIFVSKVSVLEKFDRKTPAQLSYSKKIILLGAAQKCWAGRLRPPIVVPDRPLLCRLPPLPPRRGRCLEHAPPLDRPELRRVPVRAILNSREERSAELDLLGLRQGQGGE